MSAQIASILAAGLLVTAVIGQDTPPQLDPRIEPSRITESDLPPLPEEVISPLPPRHQVPPTYGSVAMDEQRWNEARNALRRGLSFLRDQQHESGAWLYEVTTSPTGEENPSPVSIAVTAMASKAFLQIDLEGADDPVVRKGLRFVRQHRNEDGSYEGGALTNYVTSAVVSALAAVPDDRYGDLVQDGVTWLQTNQWDEDEGLRERQDWYGGAGYGGRGRPDLSNTQMMLDALYDSGMSPDEPAYQRAAAFVSRAQNLDATNRSSWAGNDGGFVYTPANGGESMASEIAGEGRYGEIIPRDQARSLRSYGSMTYAGFKSLLYAGLSPDDIRVRAAFQWIRDNWTFDENPGLGQQGLFYYYHAMARALRVGQQDVIADTDGVEHNWRDELVQAILDRQGEDGSWSNGADRWLEGDPVMATIYAVLAIEEAMKGE